MEIIQNKNEEKLKIIENKLIKLENKKRIKNNLNSLKLYNYKLMKVSSNYYNYNLNERSQILNTFKENLCKSIIIQNNNFKLSSLSSLSSNLNENDGIESKYYCIVIQYIHKLNIEKLKDFIQGLRPLGQQLPRKRYHFQLAPEEVSHELTGFIHNAVSPIGLAHNIPIILCQSCLELSTPIIWMGGGEVDVKLGLSVVDFVRATKCLVGDLSDPREISSSINIDNDES